MQKKDQVGPGDPAPPHRRYDEETFLFAHSERAMSYWPIGRGARPLSGWGTR
jgi:hypothetical protein